MSYAQNNYSWYPSKSDVTPAQPGVAPQLYNTAAQHGVTQQHNMQPQQWNSGVQTQPYWQPNQQQQHQPQQQQQQQHQHQQHQPAASVHQTQNHNTVMQNSQWTASESPDPWNWGVDDNAAAPAAAPKAADAWDWGVQPAEPPAPQYYPAPTPANNNPLPPADANNYFYAPPQPAQHSTQPQDAYHHSTAANENTLQTSLDYAYTNSGNYFAQQPTEHLSAPSLVNFQNATVQRNDASNIVADVEHKPDIAYNDVNHLPTDNGLYHNIGYNPADGQEDNVSLSNANYRTSVAPALATSDVVSTAGTLAVETSSGYDVLDEPRDNISDVSGSSYAAATRDYSGLEYLDPVGATTGNKGLAAQWSTESLHSQGSDDVSPSTPHDKAYQYDSYSDSPSGREATLYDEEQATLYDEEQVLEAKLDAVCDGIDGLNVRNVERAAETGGFGHEPFAFVAPPSNKATPPPAMSTPPLAVPTPPPATQMPPQSTQMPPPSGQMPPSSAQMPPPSAQMPPPSAQMPPPATQMPPPSAQMPPSVQMQPPSAQMPPPSVQMPPPSAQMTPSLQMPPPSAQIPPPSMQMPPPKTAGAGSENPFSVSRAQSHSRYRFTPAASGKVEQPNYMFMQPTVEPVADSRGASSEDSVNLETLPDNVEQPDAVLPHRQPDAVLPHRQQMTAPDAVLPHRQQDTVLPHCQQPDAVLPHRQPDAALPHRQQMAAPIVQAVERMSVSPMGGALRTNPPPVGQDMSARQWGPDSYVPQSPDNQEVALPGRCGPNRNQYLETGQLCEDDPPQHGAWPGMQQREGEGRQANEATPPPGLHRMVPGQVTEQDNRRTSQLTDDQSQDSNDDVMLRRMVPGQPTDIPPPPGLRRMVPGESSSPESQPAQAGSRVVTGDGREEDNSPPSQPVPTPATLAAPTQPPPIAGERSETIGSDSVETYPSTQADTTQRESTGNRRDTSKHDRHHRDTNETGDESDGRRRVKKDYRGREREESPGGGGRRYKTDARKGERDRQHNRHANEERRPGVKEQRTGERRGRQDATDSDTYSSDQYGGRYKRRDKSTDSRRYDRGGRDERGGRDDRGGRDERGGRQYDRDGYGRDSRNEREAFNKSRRAVEPRESDSEANSDYDRRHYDRKGYPRRRDYDQPPHGKPRYRDDYDQRRRYPPVANLDSSRYRGADRSEADRSRYDTSFREKTDHRPDSRGQQSRMYPPEQQAYFAGPKPQYTAEYYAYYQQLRVTDPVAYAEWYNTVYARQIYPQSVSFSEDRGSVHSGRSSDNNNAYRERDSRPETNEPPASSTPQRLTPTFFSTPHVKGTLTDRGQMIKVLPNYPLDGQPATVEIHDMQGLYANSVARDELMDFPGPLIKGSTHKNSIISFCQRRISNLESDASIIDRDSAILLWQLLILLIKQNGNVVGTDISELLLTSRPCVANVKRSSVSSHGGSQHGGSRHGGSHGGSQHGLDEEPSQHAAKFNVKSEEDVTNTFRDYLLYGNVKEALEWAMRNGLWGHALFLASKTDARQHANVMMRFANGLPFNDPLQTLYQIKSGRQPAAVTGCIDEKWGSWKPHLAMILANPSTPEVGHKAILTLGDTLASRGCLYAAHFTYLMAQCEFASYAQRTTSRLVLIGASHHRGSFNDFASNEAIQMTEVYEYALRLADSDTSIPNFQIFKYVYAQRLLEQNMVSEALLYAEEISKALISHPDLYEEAIFKQVYELGDRLKYRDPLYTNSYDDAAELPWLVQLSKTMKYYNDESCHPDTRPIHESTLNRSYTEYDHAPQAATQPEPRHDHEPMAAAYDPTTPAYEPSTAAYDPMTVSDGYETALSDEGARYTQYTEQQQQWQQTQQWQQQAEQHDNTQGYDQSHVADTSQSQSGYQNQWEESTQVDEPQPQISLPNAYSDRSEKPPTEVAQSSSPAKPRPPAAPRGKQQAGNGWFGGIWNKLSLKPKNQMILPEDKNPTIVWDPDRKRWVNMDADGEEPSAELAPPPKASDMMGAFPTPAPAPTPQAPRPKENGDIPHQPPAPAMANGSAVNKYKLNNKGKSFRSNYVDVFGGSKMAAQTAPPPGLFPLMAGGTQSIFTPGARVDASEADVSSAANEAMFETPQRQPAEVQAPQVFAPNVSDNRSAHTGPMMYDPRSYAQPNANQYAAH